MKMCLIIIPIPVPARLLHRRSLLLSLDYGRDRLLVSMLAVTLNQDCMFFVNFFVNSQPFSLKFCKGHFLYSNPNSSKKNRQMV